MEADLKTLLQINTVLAVVPIVVGVGVTRILARQRQQREDLEKVKKDSAVVNARMSDVTDRVVRLENLVMKEGGE